MSYAEDFNAFVGGKSGVFKGVHIGMKTSIAKNLQSLISIKDHDEVTTMAWADKDEKEVLIACGEKTVRSIKIYDTECSAFTCSFLCSKGKGSINGISKYNGGILTATNCGEIRLWKFDEDSQVLLNAGTNLHKMRHSRDHESIIATGGQEHPLKLFDLEKKVEIFVEKNLPHDWLELRVPIWVADIAFIPSTEQVVTAGRHGHIRLYDPKTQRRPVINLELKDEALTSVAISSREKQVIVGSGKGRMNLVDLRKPGRILNTYKGFAGGVTGIACSTCHPYVASISLDRYLRVHHVHTKELLQKIYLTSKLTCIVLRSAFALDAKV